MKVILASASPRRREILAGLGVEFEVIVANADETVEPIDPVSGKERSVGEIVCEISRRKAQAVLDLMDDADRRDGLQ